MNLIAYSESISNLFLFSGLADRCWMLVLFPMVYQKREVGVLVKITAMGALVFWSKVVFSFFDAMKEAERSRNG